MHACPGYRFVSQPHRLSSHRWLAIPLEPRAPARTPTAGRVVVLDVADRRIAWPADYRKPLSPADRTAMLRFIRSDSHVYVDWHDDRVTLTLFGEAPFACDPWVPLRLE